MSHRTFEMSVAGIAATSLVVLLDAVIALVALAVVLIALTGGTTVVVGGMRLSMHSVGNGILGLFVIGSLRILVRANQRFLGGLARSPVQWGRLAAAWLPALQHWLTQGRHQKFLLFLVASGVLLRAGTAIAHPGFFSGDDVEIHEMTLASLHGASWTAWELRSAFYPMTFIYPIQRLVWAAGELDPAALVVAGRLVVVTLSPAVILLTYRIGRQRGPGVAASAAAIVSMSALLVTFGSTELPRPVSTLFVLGGFLMLSRNKAGGDIAAGLLIGIAAAMRFSEAIFVIPALLQTCIERRWRSALFFATSAAVTALAVQMTADLMYWGQPFASLRAIVDFTLVRGLSSRGYESAWHYAVHLTDWTDYFVVALASIGVARQSWRWLLWASVPLLFLSALPHKEARYLIPVFPFVALLAAAGLVRLTSSIMSMVPERRAARAGILLAGALCSLLFQVSGMHVRRSDDAVRFLRTRLTDQRIGADDAMLIEQAWRLGGRIYLGHSRRIHDVDATGLPIGELERVADLERPSWVWLKPDTCERINCIASLQHRGFDRLTAPDQEAAIGYVVMRRVTP